MLCRFIAAAILAIGTAAAGPTACTMRVNCGECDHDAAVKPGLPSWHDGAAKAAFIDFVRRTTTKGGQDYLRPEERIAVFDNDGTLWSEQPMYFQLLFAVSRVQSLAPEHPEWRDKEPFASIIRGDVHSALSGGEHAILEVIMATHAGMTTDEFDGIVRDWIKHARHPTTGRLLTDMTYQPMLEVLGYLKAHGYATYIVSGGGIDFMRPWAEEVYGIPPQRTFGSAIQCEYEVRNGEPLLIRLPKMDFIDDKEGKVIGIQRHIGRRPVMAFGNSDGDFQMLEWTTSGHGPRFGMLIHHTDAQREWAYDRDSHIGRLMRGLDEAPSRGWIVVDMKRDWRTVHPPP